MKLLSYYYKTVVCTYITWFLPRSPHRWWTDLENEINYLITIQ